MDRNPIRLVPALALAATLALAAAAPAIAQDDGPGVLTWIAYSKTRPNQTEAAMAMLMEDKAFMDGLMADGTILGWGVATPINHSPGDLWNFIQWVHVEDWTKADAWVNASIAKMQAEDEVKRKAMQARFAEIFVEGSHFDEVVRHDVARFSGGGATPPRYLYSAEFAAQPGKEGDLVSFFKTHVTPVVDDLVENGTLTGYGVYSPELHLDVEWTHRFWYALPDLGKMDAMLEAFGGMSEAQGALASSIFESEGHHDKVLLILHLGTPGEN